MRATYVILTCKIELSQISGRFRIAISGRFSHNLSLSATCIRNLLSRSFIFLPLVSPRLPIKRAFISVRVSIRARSSFVLPRELLTQMRIVKSNARPTSCSDYRLYFPRSYQRISHYRGSRERRRPREETRNVTARPRSDPAALYEAPREILR